MNKWTNTLKLHQQDFLASSVVDWEECFSNETVESYELLLKYLFEVGIHNKTVDDKAPS